MLFIVRLASEHHDDQSTGGSVGQMDIRPKDTGLDCLALLLRFHQVAIDPAQIAHQLGNRAVGVAEMLRCAKELKLKARVVQVSWFGLMKLPSPFIAERKDGGFVILGKVDAEQALVHDPLVNRPQIVKRADFEGDWTGRIVLMARRASLSDLARHFDITWFLQAMVKYRHILAEVLLASFVLQLFVSHDAIAREKPTDRSHPKAQGALADTSEPAGQEFVYAANIELDTARIEVEGRMVDVAPSMAVTIEIKTGSRRIIEYELSPLLRYKQESLRER
jgi:hypothetical protein